MAPEAFFWLMLAPASIGPGVNSSFMEKDIIDSIALVTTWSTRLGIIYDLLKRIDFSFYCSPKGDLVCEMPLYDFDPDDFGNAASQPKTLDIKTRSPDVGMSGRIASSQLAALELARREDALARAKSLLPKGTYGPYAPLYRFRKEDMVSWERTFADEKVRTQYVASKASLLALAETGGDATSTLGEPPGVRTAFSMVPAFGVRAEQSDLMGFIKSPQVAALYAEVQLNKLNADARSAHVEVMPRIQVGVNRPLEFAERHFVATTRQVTHAIRWGQEGEMSTSVDVNYVRGWSGQIDKFHRPLYEPLGGFASRTLNYAIRLQSKDPPASTKSPRSDDG